ncbi:MAG: iron ABC transporter permease [Rhodothermales bacterium]|nr:iron ABC transporter permease [Rhodothermales bacterium]
MQKRLFSYRGWLVGIPVAFVALAVMVPILYLFVRAFDADGSQFIELLVRRRSVVLLLNTVSLAAVVLVLTTIIGFVFAWLAERTTFLSPRILTILGVLPLAVPGYVMAYVMLGSLGDYGLLARLTGIQISTISGFGGSALVLTLYTFPYMFLNLRSGLAGLDPALEESSRTLGYSSRDSLRYVVLPQLRPAFLAGAMLVVLHVLGDFGVVSLMRFETLSYAVFLQYSAAFDRTYAACLALILLLLSGLLLYLEFRLLRGFSATQSWTSPRRRVPPKPAAGMTVLGSIIVGAVALTAVCLPIVTIAYWSFNGTLGALSIGRAFRGSISAALPAAALAGFLALSIAYVRVRYTSRATIAAERIAYIGYATPALAFALAIIFFSLKAVPGLYQSMTLMILALSVHFLAEAIGPIRTALLKSSIRLEEAARSLGRSGFQAFREVTFPTIRSSVLAGTVLVFLSVMKELPITLLLSPTGFRSLAVNVWMFTNEAQFGMAAPFALLIIFASGCFAAFALRHHDPIPKSGDQ